MVLSLMFGFAKAGEWQAVLQRGQPCLKILWSELVTGAAVPMHDELQSTDNLLFSCKQGRSLISSIKSKSRSRGSEAASFPKGQTRGASVSFQP